MNIFNKTNNKIISGVILGSIVFAISALIVWGLVFFLMKMDVNIKLDITKKLLISILPNLVLLRYFFINKNQENTGKGIIIVSFVVIVSAFLIILI